MNERAQLLIELADDELILGWRDSEWTGIAPFLEEDVAFSSIAQNEIGHARALYEVAARDLGTDADSLAFDRRPEEYRCAPLVQLRLVPDWAATIARHYLYETADAIRLEVLRRAPTTQRWPASRPRWPARSSTTDCTRRCGPRSCGRSRASSMRSTRSGATRWACSTRRSNGSSSSARVHAFGRAAGRRAGRARPLRRVRAPLGGDDDGAPLGAQVPRVSRVVTEAAVWEALAQIPDPEIPVISLVDLGVVKTVEVEGERVRIEFTPTFMGCPRSRRCAARWRSRWRRSAASRGRRRPRRLLVDRQDHAGGTREAPRGRLRASSAARGRPDDAVQLSSKALPLPVLRLDRDAAREHLRPDPVPLGALLRAAGSRSSSSRRSRSNGRSPSLQRISDHVHRLLPVKPDRPSLRAVVGEHADVDVDAVLL